MYAWDLDISQTISSNMLHQDNPPNISSSPPEHYTPENSLFTFLLLANLHLGRLSFTVISESTEMLIAFTCGLSVVCSHLLPTVEISEMSVTQSVECPLTVKDTAIVSGNLSTRNGTGVGTIGLALRRVLSHTAWAEVIGLYDC